MPAANEFVEPTHEDEAAECNASFDESVFPATQGKCLRAIFSIATGTLPLSLFGSSRDGRLQEKVMSARLVVGALAPFAFAMAAVGSTVALVAVAVIGGIAVLSFQRIGKTSH